MTVSLHKKVAASATPILCTSGASWAEDQKVLTPAQAAWARAAGFSGKADTHCLLPDDKGELAAVLAGTRAADDPYALAALPQSLPSRRYRLASEGLAMDPQAAALSWSLGDYVFDAYKARGRAPAELLLSDGPEAQRGLLLAGALCAVRDLVNTPAEACGPQHLEAVVRQLAKQHKAKVKVWEGEQLLKANFPAIHAVGRAAASDRAPRLIELSWGSDKKLPQLSLVGKGVCFDSGGLDIKPADGMRQMKKDMGGAANAIGLAMLVMSLRLPVRLQLLVPAVENAISGNAFRPGDIFRTRSGKTIEIGNTDAEGRVILCDALSYACEAQPDLIIDLATLTGAARVALGPELPALFCRDLARGRELTDLGLQERDPLWPMPLWQGYQAQIDSPIADIVNTGGPMAGAVTAALFLERFIPDAQDWMHIDLFAWNSVARAGRPVGGEAQTLRTLLHWLERRYAG